jgi:subtilisin family serine protease
LFCDSNSNSCYAAPPTLPKAVVSTSFNDYFQPLKEIQTEEIGAEVETVETGNYIVEFKEEPVAETKAEIDYEISELGDVAESLKQEAKTSLGTNRLTKDSQIAYIEKVAAEKDKQEASLLTEQRNKVTAEQNSAISDLVSRLQAGKLSIANRYKTVFNGVLINVSDSDLEIIKQSPYVKNVYPNLEVKALLTDSVPRIGAPEMWQKLDSNGQNVTGKGIRVAIIDTGIDYTHPDLGGCFGTSCKVIGGWDFVNNDADPKDDNGHGTHCAGIVAANGVLKGVAPDAKLYAYKILDSGGTGSMSGIVSALEAAMDPNGDGNYNDHVDVASMSLGGGGDPNDAPSQAVKRAVDAGITVVVAAGNSGPSFGTVSSPGCAEEAITVGAVDKSGVLAKFSSRGRAELLIKPEISAPGVSITSTVPYSGTSHSSPTGYMAMSGTSMATPHVAGAVALLKQAHPDWTPSQIKSAIITGARPMDASLWYAGAGELYVPNASSATIFASNPIISYGSITNAAQATEILNSGQSRTFTITTKDWRSMFGNFTPAPKEPVNQGSASPASAAIGTGGSQQVSLLLIKNPVSLYGYFDGSILMSDGQQEVRFPFGYVDLSKITIHVTDNNGGKVCHPNANTYVFDTPNPTLAFAILSSGETCGPGEESSRTFLLPPGNYRTIAMGHELLFTYNDPYLLSANFTVSPGEDKDIYLRMSDAAPVILNRTNQEGYQIYPRDYRVYWRYTPPNGINLSDDSSTTDYSIAGQSYKYFSLPKQSNLFVSDFPKDIEIGFQMTGYAYSKDMWNFMNRNWQNFYDTRWSVPFYQDPLMSTGDLKYLLSWEFHGFNASVTPRVLGIQENNMSEYHIKYNILGTMDWPYLYGGDSRASGLEAAFWTRRDTDTSLNPFFSGMTRTTYVQGVFTDKYFPENVLTGHLTSDSFVPNYNVMKKTVAQNVYMVDRNFLTPVQKESVNETIAAGPLYPSLHTENRNDTMVLFSPLLHDQSGADSSGYEEPMMYLYYNKKQAGVYALVEFATQPPCVRYLNLSWGAGTYEAQISYSPFYSEISNSTEIHLGFKVPGNDIDPPYMTGFSMPQRFVSGQPIGMNFSAADDKSPVTASAKWRPGATGAWTALPLTSLGSGRFSAAIPTAADTSVIDLYLNLSDSSGNYLEYTSNNAALKQVPVYFDLSPASLTDFEYKNTDAHLLLTGRLTTSAGTALHPVAGIPLELKVGNRKVALLLDEYVDTNTHAHNGTIRFDWHFNPVELFTQPGETLNVSVSFDLGVYEPITRSFTLHASTLPFLSCSDWTPYGNCSNTKPKYCDNGNLIDRCDICGCPSSTQNCKAGACYEDSPPVLSTPQISSQTGSFTTDDIAVCTAKVSDSDNSVLTVYRKWNINGIDTGTASSDYQNGSTVETTYPLKILNVGDSIYCIMRAFDGKKYSSWERSEAKTVQYGGPACIDGTPYNQCSATKPVYCDNGTLVGKCSVCGCPVNQTCSNNACHAAPVNNPPTTSKPFLVSTFGANTTSEDLTCSAQVTDLDGDPINATTNWYNNSSLFAVSRYNGLSNGNFSTAVLKSGNLSVGQKWQCKIMVTDGKANSTWSESNNLTIRNLPGVNSPPNAPQPSLVSYDGSNTVNSDLLCYDTIVDLDNDRMNATVSWFKNGVPNSTKNYNNNYPSLYNFNVSLAKANLTLGDTWQCSIRLSDGKNYSGTGYSSNLTIVSPPVTQPPTGGGGGGGGGGGWTPPKTNLTVTPTKEPCVSSLEVTVPEQIFVPQGVTKEISVIVKNTGTCNLSSVTAVLSLPTGWSANSYMLDSGLGVNETGIMSIRLFPLYSPIGNYPVTVRLDALNVTMSKSAKVWLLENPPSVVSQEGPSASRIFEYIIALILIEFVFGSIVMVVWFKPPEERLPPLPALPPLEQG